MNIFISQVPDSLTKRELQRFVNHAVKPRWRLPFLNRTGVSSCTIIRISAKDTNTVESHGLIRVEDPKCAAAIIQKLNGARLKGKKVEVRRYVRRSACRDRRIPNAHLELFFDNERRRRDRRRSRLTIGTVQSPQIEGLDRFHRTYG